MFTILWLTLSTDDPESHRWISPAEREYVVEHRSWTKSKQPKTVSKHWGFLYRVTRRTQEVPSVSRPPSSTLKFLRCYKEVSFQTPWKKILLSPAVLLLGYQHFCTALNFYMIVTELPSYLKYMFGINIVDVSNQVEIHGVSSSEKSRDRFARVFYLPAS